MNSLRRRRVRPEVPAPPRNEVLLQAQHRAYADGLLDGMEIALSLLLGGGRASVQGVPPCPGVLPWHVHRWARSALRRIEEAKR